jgi:hypothetical protein
MLPPASPNKPAHARGAPTHVHVSMEEQPAVAQPPSAAQAAAHDIMMAGSRSRVAAAEQAQQAKALPGAKRTASGSPPRTPVRVGAAGPLQPPSSSKRMLAPNGQPRKIPMALDFGDGARRMNCSCSGRCPFP